MSACRALKTHVRTCCDQLLRWLDFTDPHGFSRKRRKTTEHTYTGFTTDAPHLPKSLALFTGKVFGLQFIQGSEVAEMGDRLATIDMGRKLRGCAPGSPCNTTWPGLRPTFVSSGILIHPAGWPQQAWANRWGREAVSLFRWLELGPHLTQCGLGEAYLHTKWHMIHPAAWPQ